MIDQVPYGAQCPTHYLPLPCTACHAEQTWAPNGFMTAKTNPFGPNYKLCRICSKPLHAAPCLFENLKAKDTAPAPRPSHKERARAWFDHNICPFSDADINRLAAAFAEVEAEAIANRPACVMCNVPQPKGYWADAVVSGYSLGPSMPKLLQEAEAHGLKAGPYLSEIPRRCMACNSEIKDGAPYFEVNTALWCSPACAAKWGHEWPKLACSKHENCETRISDGLTEHFFIAKLSQAVLDASTEKTCTCGASSVGSRLHSEWCDCA